MEVDITIGMRVLAMWGAPGPPGTNQLAPMLGHCADVIFRQTVQSQTGALDYPRALSLPQVTN